MAQGVWESVHYSHEETIPRLGNAHLDFAILNPHSLVKSPLFINRCLFFKTHFNGLASEMSKT